MEDKAFVAPLWRWRTEWIKALPKEAEANAYPLSTSDEVSADWIKA